MDARPGGGEPVGPMEPSGEDALEYPPDRAPGHECEALYYRPAQLLVAAADYKAVAPELDVEIADKPEDLSPLGHYSIRVKTSEPIPELVERLRRIPVNVGADEPPRFARVGVNHVLHLASHIQWSAACAPEPSDRQLPPLDDTADNSVLDPVRIGVVDSGVEDATGWFGSHLERSAPEPGSGRGPLAYDRGHGTFVAGTALHSAYGSPAPAGGRRPITVIGRSLTLDRYALTDELDVASHILAVGPAVDVLVLAFGGYSWFDQSMQLLRTALDLVFEKKPELVVVAAAGNDAVTRPFWPAAYPDVIGVGALRDPDQSTRACFSNHGPWVDTCAWGLRRTGPFVVHDGTVQAYKSLTECTGLLTSMAGGMPVRFEGWARWSGTSFAAPVVAGAIARGIAQQALPDPVAVTRRLLFDPATPRMRDLGVVVRG